REDVDAVVLALDHGANSSDLPLDAGEAAEDCLLVGHVAGGLACCFSHSRRLPGGGIGTSGCLDQLVAELGERRTGDRLERRHVARLHLAAPSPGALAAGRLGDERVLAGPLARADRVPPAAELEVAS